MPKKTFSPETKAEAIRLLSEGYTMQQAADHIGCNVNSIQKWKAVSKKARKKSVKRKVKKVSKSTIVATGTFDEFVQNYWREHADAAEVLQLPPDLAPKAVQYVNNVLRYAYDQLGGQ